MGDSVENINKNKVISFINHSNEIKLLNVFKSQDSQFEGITCLKDEETDLNPEYHLFYRLHKKHQVIGKAIYLPILPPNPSTILKDWWFDLLRKLPDKQKNVLREMGKGNKKNILVIMFYRN